MSRRQAAGSRQPGAYLIHLTQKIGHAGHYIGSAPDVPSRVASHRTSRGAALLREANRRGIDWHVSRTWPTATPQLAVQTEIGLKNRREAPQFCPDCNPNADRVAANPTLSSHRTGPNHPPIPRRPAAAQTDPWAWPQPLEPGRENTMTATADPDGYTTTVDPALARPAVVGLLHHLHVPAAPEPEPEAEAG
jgi:predicted GIY-YIG superfamily endonuclease